MKRISVIESIIVHANPETVRAQFADVAHHSKNSPHKGVSFEVLEIARRSCTYKQTTKVGLARLSQKMRLETDRDGTLVNHILEGPLAGGRIEFEIEPTVIMTSRVTARITGPVPFVLSGVLRRQIRRSLRRALSEDKADIEDGHYVPNAKPENDEHSSGLNSV